METKTIATIAGAAAAGGVLAFAGLSLASAATGAGTAATAAGSYGSAGYGGMRGMGGPGGMHGTPVTGEAADQVKAAIAQAYPDATVLMVEQEGDGYEAHVQKTDGTVVHVELDSAFAITGEHTGPTGGMGGRGDGMGGPGGGAVVTGENADKAKAAVAEKYPDGTVTLVHERGDGYEAHVTKSDGTEVHVELDSAFAITGEHAGPTGGMRGGPGRGHEKPLTGAKAAKVKAAAKNRVPNATVIRVERDSDGVYEAHMLKRNGQEVVVSVNKRFRVTGVESMTFTR